MARYGTSMVTGNNDASFFTFGQFAQFRAANGVSQSIGNEFFFRFRCFIFVSMGNENAGYLFSRQFKFDRANPNYNFGAFKISESAFTR